MYKLEVDSGASALKKTSKRYLAEITKAIDYMGYTSNDYLFTKPMHVLNLNFT